MAKGRVVLISSFTIDKIEVGGSTYERVGGPAYYAGATLAMMGLDPVVVTSVGSRWLGTLKGLLERLPGYRLVNISGQCNSIYIFRHRYDSTGRRHSEILDMGCDIDLDLIDPGIIAGSSWILVSPVYREISVEALKKVAGAGKVALDLQGLTREVAGGRVFSSVANLSRHLDRIPEISIIHLSSDDIQDKAAGGPSDLEAISTLTGKASAVLYTIGPHGGFIYVDRKAGGASDLLSESVDSVEQGWYYIPPYYESGDGDPTGCGDIFTASVIGYLTKGYNIVEASVRASIVSGMRVYRGFPTPIDPGEVEEAAAVLRKRVQRIRAPAPPS